MIYLNSLGYLLEIEENTPIISYTGAQEGEVAVTIYPHLLSAKGEKIPIEDLEDENLESYIGRKVLVEVTKSSLQILSFLNLSSFPHHYKSTLRSR